MRWVLNFMLSGGNFVLQVVPQADRVLIRLENLPEVCLPLLPMFCSVTSSFTVILALECEILVVRTKLGSVDCLIKFDFFSIENMVLDSYTNLVQ